MCLNAMKSVYPDFNFNPERNLSTIADLSVTAVLAARGVLRIYIVK